MHFDSIKSFIGVEFQHSGSMQVIFSLNLLFANPDSDFSIPRVLQLFIGRLSEISLINPSLFLITLNSA